MKRYTRRRKFKVKKLFILLFAVMLCVMAGKVLHSSFTTLFLGNITRHIANENHGWNLILVNRENYIPADYGTYEQNETLKIEIMNAIAE